jgi:hypothetical protein
MQSVARLQAAAVFAVLGGYSSVAKAPGDLRRKRMTAGAPSDRMQTPGKYAGPSSCACRSRQMGECARRVGKTGHMLHSDSMGLTMMPPPGAYSLTKMWLGSAGTSSPSLLEALQCCCPKMAVSSAMRAPSAASHVGNFVASSPFGVTEPPWYCSRRPDTCRMHQSAVALRKQRRGHQLCAIQHHHPPASNGICRC